MIPPEYQAVAVRLARLGRNDAYSLVEAAIAAKVPALDLLCSHLDATLARYRPLPVCTSTPALTNCASTPKVPAKAAQPAQAAKTPAPAPTEATPTGPGHVAGPAKHGADDAAKRAALRAAMADQPAMAEPEALPDTLIEPNPPTSEPNPPTSEQAPIHQLPTVCNGGALYLDSVAALAALGYNKTEARRMAKAAVEAGAADVGAVIKACTKRA